MTYLFKMKDNQYKTYLKKKEKHLKRIVGLPKKQLRKVNRKYYVPILEKIFVEKKATGIYELDGWHIYPTSRFCMNKKNVSKRINIDKFLETYLDPNSSPFKEDEIEEESYVRRGRHITDTYSYLFCCKCNQVVQATQIWDEKKGIFYKCRCGLKVATDNNENFPQPIGNICSKKLQTQKDGIDELINKFCKRSKKKRIKLYNFIRDKFKSKNGYQTGNIKTMRGAEKVYKVIDGFINQGLVNVKRIL